MPIRFVSRIENETESIGVMEHVTIVWTIAVLTDRVT